MPYGGGGPSGSMYGPHSHHSTITAGTSPFPVQNNYSWTGNPPPPPPIHQPQPILAAQAPSNSKPLSTSAAVAQGASTVVQGLMDRLLTHRR